MKVVPALERGRDFFILADLYFSILLIIYTEIALILPLPFYLCNN